MNVSIKSEELHVMFHVVDWQEESLTRLNIKVRQQCNVMFGTSLEYVKHLTITRTMAHRKSKFEEGT